MWKRYNLPGRTDYLIFQAGKSFLLLGKALGRYPLFLETAGEELVSALSPEDPVGVSAPEGGSLEAAAMLIELIRCHHLPLVILPPAHPGSKRLKYVVSAGDEIRISCSITRGTHPEQDILCGSGDFSGMLIRGYPGGFAVSALSENYETYTAHRQILPDSGLTLEKIQGISE